MTLKHLVLMHAEDISGECYSSLSLTVSLLLVILDKALLPSLLNAYSKRNKLEVEDYLVTTYRTEAFLFCSDNLQDIA